MTSVDLKVTSKKEWVEVFPFGVAMSATNVRPVMIFKDKDEKRVLPVWLSHIDAGIAVMQGHSPYSTAHRTESSPHEVAYNILSRLAIRLDKCLFKEVKGHHQFVELHFVSDKSPKKKGKAEVIEMRADDAISFCLRSGCKFFATIEYIERSRVVEGEMVMAGAIKMPATNPHPYLN